MELLELYQLVDEEQIPVYSLTHSLSLMNNDGSCAVAIDPFGLNSTKYEIPD